MKTRVTLKYFVNDSRPFSLIKNVGILKFLSIVRTLLEILTKRSQKFYKPVDPHSVSNNMEEIVP